MVVSILDFIGQKLKGKVQDPNVKEEEVKACPEKKCFEARKYLAEMNAKRRKAHNVGAVNQQTKHY